MATLEQEHAIPGRRSLPPGKQHVFAADDGRRARLTRAAGLATAALALVWLAALGVAMLGAGRLPGLLLPRAKQVGRAPDAATAHRSPFVQSPAARSATRPGVPTPRRSTPQRPSAQADRVEHPTRAPEVLSNPAPAVVPRAADPAPAAPATVQAPALRQGWARQGWTAPPGQTKRDEPVSRGNPRRTEAPASTTKTATTTQGGPQSPKKG
jgi:hypothetical protein